MELTSFVAGMLTTVLAYTIFSAPEPELNEIDGETGSRICQ